MKKKLVLSLLVVALLVTLAAAALAESPIPDIYPYFDAENSCDGYCVWYRQQDLQESNLQVYHRGDYSEYCPYCGWGTKPEPETTTVTVSTTTAVAKTTTGQRLIVRDKADFSGKVLGYLDFGAKVEVLGVEGGFARITGNCGGKTVTGYVWKKDLHNMETITYSYEVEIPQPQPKPN